MNFKYPVAETSESIEPNDNDLELNVIAYTFLRSSNLNLSICLLGPTSFSDLELLASVSMVSPQRRTRNLKKERFLCSGRFHSLAVSFRNTKTPREGETKGPYRQRNELVSTNFNPSSRVIFSRAIF